MGAPSGWRWVIVKVPAFVLGGGFAGGYYVVKSN